MKKDEKDHDLFSSPTPQARLSLTHNSVPQLKWLCDNTGAALMVRHVGGDHFLNEDVMHVAYRLVHCQWNLQMFLFEKKTTKNFLILTLSHSANDGIGFQ